MHQMHQKSGHFHPRPPNSSLLFLSSHGLRQSLSFVRWKSRRVRIERSSSYQLLSIQHHHNRDHNQNTLQLSKSLHPCNIHQCMQWSNSHRLLQHPRRQNLSWVMLLNNAQGLIKIYMAEYWLNKGVSGRSSDEKLTQDDMDIHQVPSSFVHMH